MASRGVYDLGPSRQQGGCRRGGPTRRRNRALRWARSAAPAGRVPGPRVRRPTGRRRLDTRASGRAGPATGTHIRVPPRLPGGDASAEPGRPRVSVVRGPVKAPVSVPGGARDATASYRVGPATRLRDAPACAQAHAATRPRGHTPTRARRLAGTRTPGKRRPWVARPRPSATGVRRAWGGVRRAQGNGRRPRIHPPGTRIRPPGPCVRAPSADPPPPSGRSLLRRQFRRRSANSPALTRRSQPIDTVSTAAQH